MLKSVLPEVCRHRSPPQNLVTFGYDCVKRKRKYHRTEMKPLTPPLYLIQHLLWIPAKTHKIYYIFFCLHFIHMKNSSFILRNVYLKSQKTKFNKQIGSANGIIHINRLNFLCNKTVKNSKETKKNKIQQTIDWTLLRSDQRAYKI